MKSDLPQLLDHGVSSSTLSSARRLENFWQYHTSLLPEDLLSPIRNGLFQVQWQGPGFLAILRINLARNLSTLQRDKDLPSQLHRLQSLTINVKIHIPTASGWHPNYGILSSSNCGGDSGSRTTGHASASH